MVSMDKGFQAQRTLLDEQKKMLAALEDELSRLNVRLEGLLKDAQISSSDLKIPDKLSPELESALNAAKEEAVRAGKARAGRSQTAVSAAEGKSVGRGRPGAVKV